MKTNWTRASKGLVVGCFAGLTLGGLSAVWGQFQAPGEDAQFQANTQISAGAVNARFQALEKALEGMSSAGGVTRYVRLDGDNGLCNGLADAPSSEAPNCAFMTVQAAVNSLPLVIRAPSEVVIGPGAFLFQGGSAAMVSAGGLRVDTGAGGSLRIRGQGHAEGGGTVLLSDVSSGNPVGVSVEGTTLELADVLISGFDVGVRVGVGGKLQVEGTVRIENSGRAGALAGDGGVLATGTNSRLEIEGVQDNGIEMLDNATFAHEGKLAVVDVRDCGSFGVRVGRSSSAHVTSDLTIANVTVGGLAAIQSGAIMMEGSAALDVSSVSADLGAILASSGGQFFCNGSSQTKIRLGHGGGGINALRAQLGGILQVDGCELDVAPASWTRLLYATIQSYVLLDPSGPSSADDNWWGDSKVEVRAHSYLYGPFLTKDAFDTANLECTQTSLCHSCGLGQPNDFASLCSPAN